MIVVIGFIGMLVLVGLVVVEIWDMKVMVVYWYRILVVECFV